MQVNYTGVAVLISKIVYRNIFATVTYVYQSRSIPQPIVWVEILSEAAES